MNAAKKNVEKEIQNETMCPGPAPREEAHMGRQWEGTASCFALPCPPTSCTCSHALQPSSPSGVGTEMRRCPLLSPGGSCGLFYTRLWWGERARLEGGVASKAGQNPFPAVATAGPPHSRIGTPPCPVSFPASPVFLSPTWPHFSATGSRSLGMDGPPLCYLGQSAVPPRQHPVGYRRESSVLGLRRSLSLALV